jgi:hypothetical protein
LPDPTTVGYAEFIIGRAFAHPLANPPYKTASQLQKRELLRLARKRNLEIRVRQNNPTGKSPKTLSSPRAKNIPLNPSGKSSL